nr:hypothetical protein [Paracoccus sp. Z118]
MRLVVVLLILALIGLAGYAYFGDMAADPTEIRVPVQLELGAPDPQDAAAVPNVAPVPSAEADADTAGESADDLD